MSHLYPLRFVPTFRRYLWGGRRLETFLHKPLGAGDDYAESWELVDHGADQSLVAYGPLQGRSLHELVSHAGAALLGKHAPLPAFPLLFKYLDAQQPLSLQVHPNDQQAAQLRPPDRGKTEAWVVVHAEPGSCVYAGLRPGVTRESFQQSLRQGTAVEAMHTLAVQAGDCIFIPAGTVHALGAGILLAEIQQASDTTFRLWDWNRVGADGRPRALHLEAGLAVADFQAGPVTVRVPQATDRAYAQLLVACEHFVLERWEFHQPLSLPADERFLILSVLAGALSVTDDPASLPLARGQTMLLPAHRLDTRLTPQGNATVLAAYLP